MHKHSNIRRHIKPVRKYNLRPSPANHPLILASCSVPPALKPAMASAPPTGLIDYRRWFPGIRNQGVEGSCTGHATAAFREVLYGIVNQKVIPARRSPAYLYARTRIAEGTFPRDAGATMADEFAVLQSFGVCAEEDMPYDDTDPGEPVPNIADADAATWRVGIPCTVDLSDPRKVYEVLAAGMPICIAIPVYASFEDVGADGIIPIPDIDKEPLLGGHGLPILGADFDKKQWIIPNSWGAGWGDNGWCYMPFAYAPFVWEAWTAK